MKSNVHDGPTPPILPVMRIAKPLLLVTTPIGVGWGLYEAWKVGWWLGLLMAVMVGLLSLFSALTVQRIRRERREGH
jgi:hypothetical protein